MTGHDSAFEQTLGNYLDALDAARNALSNDEASGTSIRRLAEALGRAAGPHGYTAIGEAAQAVVEASPANLGAAAERLVTILRRAVTDPTSREQAVLIVDDDPALTRLLTKVLEYEQRTVLVAGSGGEMVALLRSRWVDLIILDVGLPDLDGREVLSGLRRNPLTADLPVLVLTAASEPWVEAECQALGATGFLHKPIDPVALVAMVGRELTRSQRRQRAESTATAPTHSPPAGPVAGGAPRSGEVLLAEHDPLVAQIIRHRLEREGLTIRHFPSGTAALQAAKHLTPALVIVDAMTPGIDGIELLRQLRQMEHYRTVPVLVLSDIGSEREVVRALEAGADDCIRKPFSPTELVARIDRLLRRS